MARNLLLSHLLAQAMGQFFFMMHGWSLDTEERDISINRTSAIIIYTNTIELTVQAHQELSEKTGIKTAILVRKLRIKE